MKSLYILLNIVCITLVAYLGVSGFYKAATAGIPAVQPPAASSVDEADADTVAALPLSHYTPITRRDLFNTAEAAKKPAPKPAEKPVTELEQTKLNLQLYGTVTGEPDRCYAVILDGKRRRQQLYGVGDTVQTATIKQILRNRVVLHVNGKDEVLDIQKRRSSGRPARSVASAGARKGSGSTATVTQRISLSRSQVDNAMQNVNTLMRQARVRPYFRNGKPGGLRLTRIRHNSIFRRLGLRNGDIITGVNGDDIKSVDDALKFYSNLKSSPRVSLQIKRRGRLRNLDYTIQ